MIYGSVCSGVEAATVAWHGLGWEAAFFSDIENFPSQVLRHHYGSNVIAMTEGRKSIPRRDGGVFNFGDFTTIRPRTLRRLGISDGTVDLLVSGTPCQDYSIAGKRAGLAGARGNLTLEYARLAQRLGVHWLLWENVPGVFSSNRGMDFGAVLASFAGYPAGFTFTPPEGGWRNSGIVPPASPDSHGLAWRTLDAQYFGVPQRRRRVFIVGYLGDWRPAAAVLFERESLCGDITPRRETRESVAGTIGARTGRSVGAQDAACGHMINSWWPAEIAPTLNANFGNKLGLENQHINAGGLFVGGEMSRGKNAKAGCGNRGFYSASRGFL